MTIDEAKSIFSKSHPELTITKIVDFDNDRFVLCAVKDLENKMFEMDPFYSVNKKTKEVQWFSPIEDLEKFGRLMSEV